MSEPTARDLAADVEDAIAKVATNGTIVCQCCNASDVTDDDHRDGCPVWELRRAVQARVDTLTRENERLTEHNRSLAGRLAKSQVALGTTDERAEAAEAALARAEEFIQSGNWIKKSDHEAVLADTRRALEEIEELCDHWKRHDATDPDEHERWRKAAIARAELIGVHARRALAAGKVTR